MPVDSFSVNPFVGFGCAGYRSFFGTEPARMGPVSYTPLDVYKRQSYEDAPIWIAEDKVVVRILHAGESWAATRS